MNLNAALTLLADRLQVSADDLIAYADEDQHGGRGVGFNAYALDRDEGRLLYAVIRALKPETVLEIGVYEGASANHILGALEANENGELVSVDVHKEAGGGIPDSLKPRWTFYNMDATSSDLSVNDLWRYDVIFEDGDHGLAAATAVYAKVKELNPRILITHDWAMGVEHGDFFVRAALETVFPDSFGLVLDGCERGLGFWINPDRVDETVERQEWKGAADLGIREGWADTTPPVVPTDDEVKPVRKQPATRKSAVKKPPARKPSAKK